MAQSALNIMWGNLLKRARDAQAKLQTGATGSDVATQQSKAPVVPRSGSPGATQAAIRTFGAATVPNMGRPGDTAEDTLKSIKSSPTTSSVLDPLSQQKFQQRASEAVADQTRRQEIAGKADEIAGSVEDIQTGAAMAAKSQTASLRGGMADFEKEADQAEARAVAAGGEVRAQTTGAIADTVTQVNRAQGVIDAKETAALAGAARGEAAAASAAVQGMQQQTRTAIAQIQADPNLTESQKRSMIRQTQMQGAAAIMPAVGANIATFTKIRTDAAVAFGNMATQIQTAGVSGVAGIAEAGMTAFANTKVAAAQVGANILSTRANAADSYADNQAQITNLRDSLTMQGDALKASLLPHQGTQVAYVADGMSERIAELNGMMNADRGALVGMYGIQNVEDMNEISTNLSLWDIGIKVATGLIGAFG